MYGTLRVTDEGKLERGGLGAANRALGEALDALDRAQPRDEAERERHACEAIAEAGQIVSKEQQLQHRWRDEGEAAPENGGHASAL